MERHPEEFCHRCGGPNFCWHAMSPLWNAVMRGGSIDSREIFCGIVCPNCFCELAEAVDPRIVFRLTASGTNLELETVTPSGRVWNEATFLFEEPRS